MCVLWNDACRSKNRRFQHMLRVSPMDTRASEDGKPIASSVGTFGQSAAAAARVGRDDVEGIPWHSEVVAIRALRGQSERIGANLEHAQIKVWSELAQEFIGLSTRRPSPTSLAY